MPLPELDSTPPAADLDDGILALVARHTSAGVVITDEFERVIYINPAFERISGYTFAEVYGKRPGPLLQGPATSSATRTQLREAVLAQRPVTTDIVNYHKNGTPYWIEMSLVPVPGVHGNPTRFIAIEQDVTERKAATAGLAAREAELRSVFESITEHAIFLLDLRGIVQSCNSAATLLTGWPTQALQTLPIWELKSGHGARARFQHALSDAADGKKSAVSRLTRRDGTRYWARWSVSALRAEDGGVDGYVLVARDVTSEREESRVRESARQQAEELARAKAAFLANMSHEIRTPLNGVLGLTRLLLDETLTDHQRRLATTLLSSGEALLTVVNDVLDFSKLDAGKMTLAPASTSIPDLVRGVAGILTVTARSKGLQLAATIGDDVPPYVWADAGRLRQVLLNLLGNAIKFTDEGRVSLEVTADVRHEGPPLITFAVSDTGIGIPPHALDKLFKTFEQVDDSSARRAAGTGLGLAISKAIADVMGGHITVESTPGEGSCFRFTVPLPAADAIEVVEVEAPSTARYAGRRILVAEDNPVNQLVAKLMLEKYGFEVRIAVDGDEALKQILAEPWDLVLMDGSMPGKDGFEVTRLVREHESAGATRVPIVACSASAFPEDRARALASGMDGSLAKPIAPDQLLSVLDQWIPEKPVVAP